MANVNAWKTKFDPYIKIIIIITIIFIIIVSQRLIVTF